MRRVLILCTGNYYRSRFAEVLFNALAAEAGVSWRAESRGLALTDANVGPISSHALAGLTARGLAPEAPARLPLALTEDDLAGADLVVAISEAEHRPLLDRIFPAWTERVTYWRVEDLHLTPADEALTAIEREVRRLVARLAEGAPGDGEAPAGGSESPGPS